jgi:hypothetical protein
MDMTIFEAKPVDPRAEQRARRIRNGVIILVIAVIVLGGLGWWFRFWPEEHAVDKLFTAIEQKNFEQAFAVWTADPEWKSHPDKYQDYTFGQFQLDWGKTGEWGEITRHDVKGSATPKSKTGTTTGVVVVVQVNGRGEPACLWVEKKTKVISFSPYNCQF